MARSSNLSKNMNAFLDTVSFSEGTLGRGDDGYNCLFGGSLFIGYADHPRMVFTTKWGNTDAAGRYQLMAEVPGKVSTNTFDWTSKACGVSDFSPPSQDKICVYLIQRAGALQDVESGNFDTAVTKCAKTWASFPGSPWGQPTHTLDVLRAKYISLGGGIA